MLFFAFLLCACVLLLMPHHVTTKLQLTFSTLFQFPLGAGRILALAAQTPLRDQGLNPADYDALLDRIRQQQNHIDELRAELEQERSEKERLSKASFLNAWGSHGLVPAQVIQATSGLDQIVINRGKRDGLSPGLYILAENAVIGAIQDLSGHQAKGILVTDKSSHIPVYIRSSFSQPKGILYGLGKGKAKIDQIPSRHKIKIGDPVHVQTQPGLLEVPIVVGRVSQCQQNETEPLLWDISVEPATNLENVNQVVVLVAHK